MANAWPGSFSNLNNPHYKANIFTTRVNVFQPCVSPNGPTEPQPQNMTAGNQFESYPAVIPTWHPRIGLRGSHLRYFSRSRNSGAAVSFPGIPNLRVGSRRASNANSTDVDSEVFSLQHHNNPDSVAVASLRDKTRSLVLSL